MTIVMGGTCMEISKGGIVAKAVRLVRDIGQLRIGVHAANAAYFLILSFFPILTLLLGLLRYTRFGAAELVELLGGMLPQALLPEAELLINELFRSSQTLMGISAVTALWSASRGIFGLLTGLNAIYGVSESRGYFYTRAISLFYTFAFLVVLVLTLVLHVFGTGILGYIQSHAQGFWRFALKLVDLRFFLLLILQTGLFAAMFMALPDRKNRFIDSLPGAFLSSSGWLIFSHLFSIYAERSALHNGTYALAAMLWLYFCIYILFLGGVLNRLLVKR